MIYVYYMYVNYWLFLFCNLWYSICILLIIIGIDYIVLVLYKDLFVFIKLGKLNYLM